MNDKLLQMLCSRTYIDVPHQILFVHWKSETKYRKCKLFFLWQGFFGVSTVSTPYAEGSLAEEKYTIRPFARAHVVNLWFVRVFFLQVKKICHYCDSIFAFECCNTEVFMIAAYLDRWSFSIFCIRLKTCFVMLHWFETAVVVSDVVGWRTLPRDI